MTTKRTRAFSKLQKQLRGFEAQLRGTLALILTAGVALPFFLLAFIFYLPVKCLLMPYIRWRLVGGGVSK